MYSFHMSSVIDRQAMKLPILSVIVPLLIFWFATAQSQPPFSCDTSNPSTKSFPFCNKALPISERVHDLISRLTLDEKIYQLVNKAPAIERLGIPSYEWWAEALHGVSYFGFGIHFDNGTIHSATSFPQVILTAAAFDDRLWYQIGQAIGIEARAIYNAGQANGMAFWSPNINIFRDPRWGRGQETPGEDPGVTGRYAVSFVRGLQGDTYEGGKLGETLQASACCKHYAAYDLEDWKGTSRYTFDARVTAQDMADTYQPPFERCVKDGKGSGIMCAYNKVNGVPTCANYDLLTKTARGQWGFNGYIVSDFAAVSIIHDAQGYTKTPEDTVGMVLKAGMDLNCGTYLLNHTKSAVALNKVGINDIDRALTNLFSIRMRLGLFNGNPVHLPFGNIGADQVCSKAHRHLALDAARNGIVMLRNSKLLPLPKSTTKSIAVIGPNADAAKTLLGNYYGPPCETTSPLQALKSYVKDVRYHPGCDSVACTSVSLSAAVELAQSVDYVILIFGLDETQEKEGMDREDLVLPGKQQSLIQSVAQAAKKPVVLVILSGGPIDITFARYDKKIGGVLWAGYPGEAGGVALAEIIFGDHNPGGKLPMTWYPQYFKNIPMTDMRMRPDAATKYPGRTHRFYEGKYVFKFGYGLSYSNYSYKFLPNENNQLHLNQSENIYSIKTKDSIRYLTVSEMGTENCKKLKLSAKVAVENPGEMGGKHPVLLFVEPSVHRPGSPIQELVGFQSVYLNAGEKANIDFVLSPCEHLSRANEDGLMVMEEGSYFLTVGDQKSEISIFL